jgi:hypothetical protein
MVAARDTEGRPFPDDVIFGNLITMLLAGEDTTAYTLGWAVHHLCDAPEAVARVRAEADVVLDDGCVPRSIETADRLAYIRRQRGDAAPSRGATTRQHTCRSWATLGPHAGPPIDGLGRVRRRSTRARGARRSRP